MKHLFQVFVTASLAIFISGGIIAQVNSQPYVVSQNTIRVKVKPQKELNTSKAKVEQKTEVATNNSSNRQINIGNINYQSQFIKNLEDWMSKFRDQYQGGKYSSKNKRRSNGNRYGNRNRQENSRENGNRCRGRGNRGNGGDGGYGRTPDRENRTELPKPAPTYPEVEPETRTGGSGNSTEQPHKRVEVKPQPTGGDGGLKNRRK